MNRLIELDLDDVRIGMTLSDTLLDAHGGVLLPGGTILTDSNITSLRRRGIDTVVVVNDEISEADLAIERERLQQRLDRLFRKSVNDAAHDLLLPQITRYRLGA